MRDEPLVCVLITGNHEIMIDRKSKAEIVVSVSP